LGFSPSPSKRAPRAAVEVQRVISPLGIEAWLVEEHSVPFLSLNFAFRGGAKLDPRGREGLAELVSGLLNEGAGALDALAFQKATDDLAIRMAFDAGIDEFGGGLQTLTETAERAFELLALALTEPRFDADAIERVRGQLLASLERDAKNPNDIARRLWYRAAFGGHAYSRQPDGTIEGVRAIGRDDLVRFVAERLTREALVVGVAGDIDSATLGPLLDSVFGPHPETGPPFAVPEVEPAARGAVIVERIPQPQSVVLFGQRGLKRADPRFYTGYVMNQILGGGGFSSRLIEEVREKRGLAYGVFSYLSPLEHAALYLGGVATQNERVAESLAVIRTEFARMRDHGVSDEELADAKTFLTGSFPLRLDSNGEIANMLVGMQIADLGIDYLERRNGLIEAVTVEDIRTLAGELLDPDSFTVVVVGDPVGVEPAAARAE
jgi:zinc protease